jgi:DinB superfamily
VFENQEVFMNPAMTQTELVQALEARQNELKIFFSSIPEDDFLADAGPKWNPAQHLIHLTKSGSRIAQGLQVKDQLPNFDQPSSRGYETIRDTYLAALKLAPAELLAKVGASVQVDADSSQAQIIGAYLLAGTQLREAAQTWSENDLDAKAMPHPVLGNLSIREMLEFVVYHDLHHLEGVRKTLS